MHSLNALYFNIEADIYSTVRGASGKIIKDNSASSVNRTRADAEKEAVEMDADVEAVVKAEADAAMATGPEEKTKTTPQASAVPAQQSAEQSLKILGLYILAGTFCRAGCPAKEGLEYFKAEIQKHEGGQE